MKKILPLYNAIKSKSLDHYQPLRELSIDEHMVKSKGRSQFKQYIPNKPTKWGFKFWVLADQTRYALDYELYCGRQRTGSIPDHGLAYDVVMDHIKPFHFQGYLAFFDNFYSSPELLHSLKDVGIGATGTLRTNRRGTLNCIQQLKATMNSSDVPRGTGYYYKEQGNVYVCWRDNKCVAVVSNCFPRHSDGMT